MADRGYIKSLCNDNCLHSSVCYVHTNSFESCLINMNIDEKKEVKVSPSEEKRVIPQLEKDKGDIKTVDNSNTTSSNNIDESKYLSLSQVL